MLSTSVTAALKNRLSVVERSMYEMAKKVQINVDVTSDVACPWCWIGKKYLDTAMQHLDNDFQFTVRWKPFQLNPFLPDQGIPLVDYCKLKFGEEGAKRMLSESSPIASQGRQLGIKFNHNRSVVSTKKSHILSEYALGQGKQHEVQEALFHAYFSEGLDVSSDSVLKEIAERVGLNGDKALAALATAEHQKGFEDGIKEAQGKGITGVPNFEIYLPDRAEVKHSFSGAQPVDTHVAVFTRMKAMAKM